MSSKLYWDRHPETRNSILIAGTARSGTTWLAEVIDSQVGGRIVFEPFNAPMVNALIGPKPFLYLRPTEEAPAVLEFCNRIMSGRIRDPWTDKMVSRLLPRCRVVKAIRANFLLRWFHDRFPEVPILFVLRHPCAVVHSRLKLNWATDLDIQPLLDQPDLMDDFLSDQLDVILRARTPAEKHAVIWSVNNVVPLQQFRGSSLPIVYYEHLLTRPHEVIPMVFRVLQRDYRSRVYERLGTPSRTSSNASDVTCSTNRLASWKKALAPEQVKAILTIVEAFGLSHYYDDTLLPLRSWDPAEHRVPGDKVKLTGSPA